MLDRTDPVAELGGVRVPVLVVGGETDQITPVALQEQLATELSDAKLHLIPDCGHFSPLEQPAELASIVRSWLRRFA